MQHTHTAPSSPWSSSLHVMQASGLPWISTNELRPFLTSGKYNPLSICHLKKWEIGSFLLDTFAFMSYIPYLITWCHAPGARNQRHHDDAQQQLHRIMQFRRAVCSIEAACASKLTETSSSVDFLRVPLFKTNSANGKQSCKCPD